ncbi:MAG: SigB/SigF/SigG family RNA polymerase sigma factor [Lachnospiraceae bacterium]|nr:SigB/SigF/SigG family RNA polymerase sigma factor [Lachnospiraceae bacterium]
MDSTFELLKLAKEGDKDAKEQLIKENLGLVRAVSKRFIGRGYEPDDLYQIGCIGLIKCIDNFDLSYGVKLSTYAVPLIAGEIKRFIRDDGLIKVSRSLKETAYKVAKLREEIINETGNEPNIEELSKRLNISTEDIVESMEANAEVESIQKTIYSSDGNEICIMDKLANEKNEQEEIVNGLLLDNLISNLKDTEQTVIRRRYFDNKTQTEVARELNISQVQVSRLEKKILLKLREDYCA